VVQGCPCQRCQAARAARREYNRRRRQAIARPDSVWLPYVSAQPAREHLAALSAAGMGLRTVARTSGVSHGSLSKIVYGQPRRGRAPSARIRPETLRRILAVRVSHAGGGQRVPAADTWRLIDELVAAGYSRSFLARALGSNAERPTLQIGRTRVRASTARAVEDLHRRLMHRPPLRTR
jgi:lambda repressor-like predicted transcriptional regulator